MNFKAITVVFVPDGAGRTKQINAPKFLLIGVAALFFSILAFFGGIAWDYFSIKSNMPSLVSLKRENDEQRRHLTGLVSRIDQISSGLMALNDIHLVLSRLHRRFRFRGIGEIPFFLIFL